MKRGHTALEYKSKIRKLKALRPEITISTDIIVGFPGETDADFAQTMKLVEDIGFDHSFSFLFSPRPGTPASELTDSTPESVKKERLKTLQTRINQNTNAISDAMLGTIQHVLIESVSNKSDHELMGRTENNRIVHFAGHSRLIGQIMPVKITETQTFSLQGALVL
jgi:tRNA-2-methylthio-N6-dimethylallyladenosine synthase